MSLIQAVFDRSVIVRAADAEVVGRSRRRSSAEPS